MDGEEFSKFLLAQRHAMEASVYIESQKMKRDLKSTEFFVKWIKKHAEDFEQSWESSLCRKCAKVKECSNCLKENCDSYSDENE